MSHPCMSLKTITNHLSKKTCQYMSSFLISSQTLSFRNYINLFKKMILPFGRLFALLCAGGLVLHVVVRDSVNTELPLI
jgi:hypothetical protein